MTILNQFGTPYERQPDFRNATLREPDQWLIDWIRDGSATTSGVAVNESSCLRAATIWACVRNISDDIGKLPLLLYQEATGSGSKSLAKTDPLFRLLGKSPNPEMTPFTFKATLTRDVLLGGNGYGEVIRNNAGVVQEIWPINRNYVTVRRMDDSKLMYEVRMPNMQEPKYLREDQVFHIRSGMGDGLVGWSVVRVARESFGINLAQDKYNGASMGNDSTPGGIINIKHDMSDQARIRFREEWEAMHRGTEARRRVAILRADEATFQQMEMTPTDAQFVERMEHSVSEICRWFRMPPHKVHQLSDSNNAILEQQNIEYVVDCLSTYFAIWEQEIARKLIPRNKPELFAEFDANALMRGDSAARTTYYQKMFSTGSITTNEIRAEEGMNPLEGGDEPYLQQGFIPLSIAAKGPQPPSGPVSDPNAPKKPKKRPGRPTKSEEDVSPPEPEKIANRLREIVAIHRPVVAAALRPVLKNESNLIESKSRKANFGKWANDFYGCQVGYVSSTISPCLEALSVSLWAVFEQKTPISAVKTTVKGEISAVCERIVTRSKREMREPAIVRNWAGPRVEEDAEEACERIAQAVGFAAMKMREKGIA